MGNLTTKQTRKCFDDTVNYIANELDDVNYIVGFDFSISSVGVTVLKADKTLVEKRTISTSTSDGSHKERLKLIYKEMKEVLEEWRPEIIGYEGINVYTNPDASKTKALVLGTMYNILNNMNLNTFIVPVVATQIKKIILGKGKGSKSKILKNALAKFGVNLDDDDQADAFGAAVGAWNVKKMSKFFISLVNKYNPSDMNSFILDFEKLRQDEIDDFLDNENISKEELEVAISICQPAKSSGRIDVLVENNYNKYLKIRDKYL